VFRKNVTYLAVFAAVALGPRSDGATTRASAPGCAAGVASGATSLETDADWAAMRSWDERDSVLVVVDGLSDGARYAVECRKRFPRVRLVHLQSGATLPEALARSFRPADYDARFVHSPRTFARLAGELRRFERIRVRVVAGCENGVVLADRLSAELGTLGNGSGGSAARRDKWLMERQLEPLFRRDGVVRTMGSVPLESTEGLEAALARPAHSFPMALKPAGSAANFGFRVVSDGDEVRSAFEGLFGRSDPLGLTVSRVLLQPYVPGDVVAVNLTSHPRHGAMVNELWRTKVERRGSQIVFRRTELVRYDPGRPLHRSLVQGAMRVRQGLGVKFGPLHPEFLVTEDGRIYFIDAGARPAGGTLTRVASESGALDQIGATLLAAFAPRKFGVLLRRGPTLERTRALIYLASTVRGRVQSVPSEAEMKERIPGFVYADVSKMAVGATIGVSGNLFEQPGFFVVEGDEATFDAAERAVRTWEAGDFYRLGPVD
jgi:biotin carboxylase